MSKVIHVDFVGECQPGDMPPTGYLDWHEWAEVQGKAGLKQVRCCVCVKWKFPQELSGSTSTTYPVDGQGVRHKIVSPICEECSFLKRLTAPRDL